MLAEPSHEDEFYFQWHLTERCNKSCRHCYQAEATPEELALPDLLTIVDKMEEVLIKWERIGTVSLTGGEPFIRREELHALMERLDRSESILYYDILTNGSLISQEETQVLASHRKLRRIQVSLEGATAATNDLVRGTGSFDETIEAIRTLRKAGLAVSVMTTLTRSNAREIPLLIDVLGREGVATFAMERLIPEGTGAGLSHEMLNAEELKALYKSVYQIAMDKPAVRILLYRPLFAILSPDDPTVGALCSAGNNALTIMPDGTVYPCRRLPIPIGNVLTDGLFKIWYGSEVLWRIRNPENLNVKCRNCSLTTKCRGCRAMAYSITGDYMAEDCQCWI